jgi:hypothetical protein
MYRKTFETLSKWISKEQKVKIVFDTDGSARADIKNDTLHLPKDIANENAHAAIALMMHESAHIAHSKKIPFKEVAPTKTSFHILNAIEDIRIDRINFNVLPNIKEFYYPLVDKVDFKGPVSNAVKALCFGILELEGFWPRAEKEVTDLYQKIRPFLVEGIYNIENDDWVKLKEKIDKIKKLLGVPPEQDQPMPQEVQVVGQGGVDGDLSGIEKLLKPGNAWSEGTPMEGGTSDTIGELAMDEMNANQFKEILNVKERKTVSDGSTLDTETLTSLGTGDISTLFKEELHEKKKKSKVMFLLDASGSMKVPLIDGVKRSDAVVRSVRKLTRILDEVRDIEGVSVDWGIGQFNNNFSELPKHEWDTLYHPYGGTSFEGPFKEAVQLMLDDYTIDGKKIIIAMTDGDVSDYEIEQVRDYIREKHSDVRALIVGVGAMPNGALVHEIVGDNVIMASTDAEFILMEVIKSML